MIQMILDDIWYKVQGGRAQERQAGGAGRKIGVGLRDFSDNGAGFWKNLEKNTKVNSKIWGERGGADQCVNSGLQTFG